MAQLPGDQSPEERPVLVVDATLASMFGTTVAAACRTCGALVHPLEEFREQHEKWHEGLNKALSILAEEIDHG